VDSAQDAIATLGKLKDQNWNVILLDIKLPGMDGIELLQRIRETNKNVSVIIITAYASVESAVKALKIGAYDYVTKPIDPEDLDQLIEQAIGEQALVNCRPQIQQRSKRRLAEVERDHIEGVLQETNWNVDESADILDIPRNILLRKIQEHGLKVGGRTAWGFAAQGQALSWLRGTSVGARFLQGRYGCC
jgi:DNA-binding NtrC family response regulator